MEEEPKPRGGRRPKRPRGTPHPVPETSVKNLRRWQPGESGNPSGKPKSLVEITRLAREITPRAIARLESIMDNEKAPYRDQIMAAIALIDRACGRPAVGIFHGTSGSTLSGAPDLEGEDGAGATALLMAARGSKDERILAELLAEAERIRQATARDRREQEARLADAAEALSRGEEVDGLTALLLRAKAANAEREAKPAPAPKRIESKADFIVDSSGITEAAPAPSVESTPPTPAPLLPAESAPPPAPKAPPFRIEPEPTPPPKVRPAHPGSEHARLRGVFDRAGDEPSRCGAREEGGGRPSPRPPADFGR